MPDVLKLLFLLLTISALQYVTTACTLCDPDVPSKPLPPNPIRRKRENNPRCSAGEFVNDTNRECQACPGGTFMTEKMVTEGYTMCLPCTKADDASNEVEAETCSSTRDTLILCKKSFFRKKQAPSPDLCSNCKFACTACHICGTGRSLWLSHEGQGCFGFDDTICCKDIDMIVVNNTCMERPPTKLRPIFDQSTTQPLDTGTSSHSKSPLQTTQATMNHKRNHFELMFPSVLLVIMSCFLSLSIC